MKIGHFGISFILTQKFFRRIFIRVYVEDPKEWKRKKNNENNDKSEAVFLKKNLEITDLKH
jgi:hypothetical protein